MDIRDSGLVCCQARWVRIVLADPEAHSRMSLTVVFRTFIILVLQDVNGRHSCNAVLENNSKLTEFIHDLQKSKAITWPKHFNTATDKLDDLQ